MVFWAYFKENSQKTAFERIVRRVEQGGGKQFDLFCYFCQVLKKKSRMAHSYLPFTQIKQHSAIIVDSYYPRGLVLSHWRGAPTPPALLEDTSGGIVLQAIKQKWPELEQYIFVTANHFDVDGFVGVWSLLHPELALEHEELLRQMAIIGDFRELDLTAPFAGEALKLVCWINAEEKNRFYPPFGAVDLEENEMTASVPKFNFFLIRFKEVLLYPEKFRNIWEPEYLRVKEDYKLIHGPETRVQRFPELGFIVIHTPMPVHYYALFSVTRGYDIVLTCYQGQRYELECKYTTWVDIASRPTLPRPDLRVLARQLNKLEEGEVIWQSEGPTDTGPLVRVQGQSLSKAQRYAHPFERPIYPSSIPPDKIEQVAANFLSCFFREIRPKQNWTWAEIKRLNSKSTIQL